MMCFLCTTTLLLLPLTARAQDDPVPYTTFAGDEVELTPWQGEHVVVLTSPGDDLDADVMERIVDAFDAAYEYNTRITGAEPRAVEENMLNGRAVIAIVPQERVAALPRPIGTPGMEIAPRYWKLLYDGVRDRDEFDNLAFYELGFNFWRFKGLEYQRPDSAAPIVVGFAVLMRIRSMEAAGVKGGPFGNFAFDAFVGFTENLVEIYEETPELNWANTLRADRGIPTDHPRNPIRLGGADLFASFLLRLCRDYGGEDREKQDEFLTRFFAAAGGLEEPRTSEEACDNFVVCASQAAKKDLSGFFRDKWRWPVSEEALRRIEESE